MSPNTTHSTVSPKSVNSASLSTNVEVNRTANISAADDNNAQKQQSPKAAASIADASTANDKPLKMLNESSCISTSPINDFTIGLKRTLSNENIVGDKIKKSRLNLSDKDIEIPSLINSKNLKDKDHIEVLNGKLKSINSIKELCVVKKVYDPSVSNELSKENSVTDISLNQNLDSTINISVVNPKVCSPSEKSVCKKVSHANQSSNSMNDKDIAQKDMFDGLAIADTDSSDDEEIDNLNSSSCYNKLVILQNSHDEDDADTVSQLTDITVPTVNNKSTTSSNKSKSNTDELQCQTSISTNTLLKLSKLPAIQDILSEQIQTLSSMSQNQTEPFLTIDEDDFTDDDDDEDGLEVIDLDRNSNAAADKNDEDFDEKVVNDILQGITQMTDRAFPELLKFFNKKGLTFDQFESVCTQKMLEVLTEKVGDGENRKEVQIIAAREKFWRTKYISLCKQFKELKTVIAMHRKELSTNPYAKPHIITRTVGLQSEFVLNKECSKQSSKVNNANEAIDITSDDDVVELETVIDPNPKPSCSKTVESSTNTTPIKQKPSISSVLPINTPVKSVPPAMPIINNDNDTCTIDLTDDDVIEVSNGVSLDKSPMNIVRRPTISASVTPGTLTAQLTGKPQMLPKNITYIELPNLSNCNSSYIVRTAPTTGHTQIETATSLSPINRDPNKGPILYKGEKYIPVQLGTVIASKLVPQPVSVGSTLKSLQVKHRTINPVVKSVQPGVTYTTHQLSTSQSNGSLQPPPPAIPIIYKHPAPLPPNNPIQRNVPTWKKVPPAPKLSAAISSESHPKVLVLSWNLNINKTHADISAYQIFAYKEPASGVPKTEFWREIGNVTALPLPMACTLTKFIVGEKYHFAVRAKDVYCRVGPFSAPEYVFLPIN